MSPPARGSCRARCPVKSMVWEGGVAELWTRRASRRAAIAASTTPRDDPLRASRSVACESALAVAWFKVYADFGLPSVLADEATGTVCDCGGLYPAELVGDLAAGAPSGRSAAGRSRRSAAEYLDPRLGRRSPAPWSGRTVERPDSLPVSQHAGIFRTPARHRRARRPDCVAHRPPVRRLQRRLRGVVCAGGHRDVAARPPFDGA